MKRIHFLLAFMFLGFQAEVYAQPPGGCDTTLQGSDICLDAPVMCSLEGICATTNPEPNQANSPPNFCGSIENNMWYSFIAGTASVTLRMWVWDCNGNPGNTGAQIAIYGDCNDLGGTQLACNGNPGGGGGNLIISVNNLVVGNLYYVMVDGWAGDFCNIALEVLAGSTSPPMPQPPVITGPTEFCVGGTYTYTIGNCNTDGADRYTWTLPPGATLISATSGNCSTNTNAEITVRFDNSFGGQICVASENANACNPGENTCITLTELPPLTGTFDTTICDGQFIVVNGNVYNTGGTFQEVFTTPEGCDSTVTVNLTVITIPIPTMSQWGLFLFGLGIFTVFIVGLYNFRRQVVV